MGWEYHGRKFWPLWSLIRRRVPMKSEIRCDLWPVGPFPMASIAYICIEPYCIQKSRISIIDNYVHCPSNFSLGFMQMKEDIFSPYFPTEIGQLWPHFTLSWADPKSLSGVKWHNMQAPHNNWSMNCMFTTRAIQIGTMQDTLWLQSTKGAAESTIVISFVECLHRTRNIHT